MTVLRASAAFAAAIACLLPCAPASAHRLPAAPNCPIFPADNPWNQRVDRLPVASNSARIIASIGAGDRLRAGFAAMTWEGSKIGIPYTTVGASARRVHVTFRWPDQSDPGPYPIPRHVPVEGGGYGDRHVIVVDRSRCLLYELFAGSPAGKRHWTAGAGAIWNLRSNRPRPRGWTSADAAGLPILPGLARWSDVRTGSIDHALRFTVAATRSAFIFPARHAVGWSHDPALPAMGARVRLKRSFDISPFPHQAQVILRALKRYGMIVADNGPSWTVSGAPSRHWNDAALATLDRVSGSDFEVVDTRRLGR